MQDMFIVALVAIGCISGIGAMALYKGINGKLMTTIVGSVMGIVGFAFGQAI